MSDLYQEIVKDEKIGVQTVSQDWKKNFKNNGQKIYLGDGISLAMVRTDGQEENRKIEIKQFLGIILEKSTYGRNA